MAIFVSPGVYSKEKDVSDLVASIASTSAAIAGYSAKGDTTQVRLITSANQFIAQYGTPTLGNYFHYSALAYLKNGNNLYCYRVVNGALYGGVKIKASTSTPDSAAISAGASSPDYVQVSGEDNLFYIYGANPGVWNNDLAVVISDVVAADYTFNINVYLQDSDGNYQLVETWTASRKQQLDGFGRQQYLETLINGFSSYIWVANAPNTLFADTVLPKINGSVISPFTGILALAEGSDGSAIASGDLITGWDKFSNPDDVDVRILIGAGQTEKAVQVAILAVAEGRKDCIALFDVPYAETTSVSSMITFRTSTQNFNSSYCALYAPWVEVYDQYNDTIVTLPPSGYVASQYAYNDYVTDFFYPPAGLNRGILNVLSISTIFNQGDRDALYVKQVNPLQTFRGRGNVIWGQKTEQAKASALSSVNVRRLLIILEKSISASLQYFVFELNNELTRFRIKAMVETYMDDLSSRGAFQTELGDKGYLIVCDTSNNTPAIIDRNELHVDVFIKPVRAAEMIQLQTIITTTGASFNELLAQGVNL